MGSSQDERSARLTLSMVSEPGHLRMARGVAEHGAVGLLELLRHPGPGAEESAVELAGRLAAANPDRELERGQHLGLRYLVPGDEEWPVVLDDLDQAPVLHERGGAPLGLWVRGSLHLAGATGSAVAVVGSRSATSYGADISGELGADLARDGVTVVSGAAFGIDQAAHRGALAVSGSTVAVLACGADRAYPAGHKSLIDRIGEVGAVVSEAPISGAPTRIRFLARNRIIAALAGGTVVVEAAIRSGALNTASWAGGLGRVVMGVPGPVTSEPSAGVHQLIRARNALLVTRAEEVLEAVGPIGTHALADLRAEATVRDGLTPDQRQVLDQVPVQRGVPVERIARSCQLSAATVRAAIDRLDELGLIEQCSGRWRLAHDGDSR